MFSFAEAGTNALPAVPQWSASSVEVRGNVTHKLKELRKATEDPSRRPRAPLRRARDAELMNEPERINRRLPVSGSAAGTCPQSDLHVLATTGPAHGSH